MASMEEIIDTLPRYDSRCLSIPLYKYQGFWNIQDFHEGGLLAQQRFKAQPTDVFVCSCPKTGTTWLKALVFAIVTRKKFDDSTSPLLTTMPQDCIPFLEKDLDTIERNQKASDFSLVATHLPYTSLPQSVIDSDCKIVYIYRNTKDVVVSYYHFMLKISKVAEDAETFKEWFDEFCRGVSCYGPYWDHILGYWKASLERPDRFLFLKYEDMKRDATSDVKKLAEFIGYPFSVEEEEACVVENIIKLCSFDNLSNLEVNKSGKHRAEDPQTAIENRLYFRKAKDGDWENYFTEEMTERIDSLMEEKLSGTGLVLK